MEGRLSRLQSGLACASQYLSTAMNARPTGPSPSASAEAGFATPERWGCKMNYQEMMAERRKLVAESRKVFEEMDPANNHSAAELAKLEKRHSEIMVKVEDLDALMLAHETQDRADLRQRVYELEGAVHSTDDERRAARRPLPDGFGRGDTPGDWLDRRSATGGWVDKDGKPVRVLAPSETLSEKRSDGLSLGDLVRAKIMGARTDDERRALSEGTDSAGGYTVPTPLAAEAIDRLRREAVVVRAGALTVPMDSATLSMARLEADPTVAWRAEGGSVGEGDATFGRVLFEAKSLAVLIKISRELAADSINLGAMIDKAVTSAMALEIDRVALFGSGSSNQPTGVVNTSGINTVSMGTNGAALASYDKLIDAIYELHADNVMPTAGIFAPRTKAALAKLKDANDNPLTVPEMVREVPLLATTGVPINQTQGTATTASSIIYGDFRQLMIGVREEISIRTFDQLYADTGQIALVAHARVDVQLAHAAAFCQLAGIIPA